MHNHHHHHQPNSSSFSMFLTMPTYDQNIYPYASSSPVDCTLSLAPPSTRLTSDDFDSPESRPPASSRFCWDFLHSDGNQYSSAPPSYKLPNLGGAATNVSAVDALLARRCANCDTTSTPLWRNGPRGPKSLCNACGIRFKKEEKRVSATAMATATAVGGGDAAEEYNGNTTWMQHIQGSTTHKLPSYYSPAVAAGVGSEFMFMDDVDDRDSTFLSWRLNVTDTVGLVHDFTRY